MSLTEPVPAEVAAVAGELGPFEAVHGLERLSSGRFEVGCGVVIAAILAITGFVLVSRAAATGWIVLCFVLALGILATVVILATSSRGEVAERAWLYRGGFVWSDRRRRLTVLPWSRVRVHRIIKTGAVRENSWALHRDDGVTVKLTPRDLPRADLDVLGARAEREIAAARVPRALAALEAGRRPAFGDVAVDAVGISVGDDRLPWTEVADVSVVMIARSASVNVEELQVKRSGAPLVWAKVRVADIPDVGVLLAVVATLRARSTG